MKLQKLYRRAYRLVYSSPADGPAAERAYEKAIHELSRFQLGRLGWFDAYDLAKLHKIPVVEDKEKSSKFVRVKRNKKRATPRKIVSAARRASSVEAQSGTRVHSSKDIVRDLVAKIVQKVQKRAERDERQRETAKARAEAFRKSTPKKEREKSIKQSRDKRNTILHDIDAQAGLLGASFAAAGALIVIKAVKKAMSGVKKHVDNLTATLKEFFKSISSKMGVALAVVPFLLIMWYIVETFDLRKEALFLILTFALSAIVGKKCWEQVSKFFHDGQVSPQGGGISSVSTLLSTVLCFSVFKGRKTPYQVGEFTKRISNFDRMGKGLESFIDWMLSSIDNLLSFIAEKTGLPYRKFMRNAHEGLEAWVKQVDEAYRSHNTADVDVDPGEINKLLDLVNTGHGYLEVYRNMPQEKLVRTNIHTAMGLVAPHIAALNGRKNYRMEPECFMICGQPGIGKTLMAMPVCATLLIKSGILPKGSTYEEVAARTFQKGNSEYWNGYAAQDCVIMDDAFQQRVSATDKDNEFITLIRSIGCWSFPLNFADLNSKGKIFYASKLVFGTTNILSIASEAGIVIQEPEAVARRIGFGYRMFVKDEYQIPGTGKLDFSKFKVEVTKCAENAGAQRFPWYIWEMAKHDFISGATSNHRVPALEVLDMVAESLKKRADYFEESKDMLSMYVSALSAEPQSGFSPTRTRDKEGVPMTAAETIKILRSAEKVRRREEDKDLAAFKIIAAAVGFTAGWYATSILVRVVGGLCKAFVSLFKRIFCRGKKKEKKSFDMDSQSNRPVVVRSDRYVKTASTQSIDTSVCTNAYGNTYKAYIDHDGVSWPLGQVMFITGDLAVQPQHYTQNVKDWINEKTADTSTPIQFVNSLQSQFRFSISVSKYLKLQRTSNEARDIEFVRFEDVRSHRNITTNFIREGDIKFLGGQRARLDMCQFNTKKADSSLQRSVMNIETLKFGENLRYMDRRLERFFEYRSITTRGDCGAPLCVFDCSPYSGRAIIGMHVAGSVTESKGFATIITQDMISKVVKDMDVIDDQFEVDLRDRGVIAQSGFEHFLQEPGSMLPLFRLEDNVPCAVKTKYYPVQHVYGDLGEYSHRPAPLAPTYREGELVYPMHNALKPYSSPLLIYEHSFLEQSAYTAFSNITRLTDGYSRRLLTSEEAILGVPEEKFRSIPRGTAAGFPYCYDVVGGKKEFFGDSDEYDLTSDKCKSLLERVDYVVACAERGVRLSHVFVDFLKDELRTQEKVEAVATRLISSAPLDYTIAWRRYFGAFSSAVMRNHTRCGMAPGICAYTEWDVLADQLGLVGSKVFDGDFKAFDSSEQPVIHRFILDYINEWYDDGPINARVRKVLWEDLVHSRHVGGSANNRTFIYQWNKSLPSGHPFTTIVNSMYSLLLLVACYVHITGDLVGFWRNVSPVTYGDDNAVNTSDCVSHQYNQITVATAMRDLFGITYTPGRKDGVWAPNGPITDITFLKRGFLYAEDGLTCPLEIDSFYYTAYYCKNKRRESEIILDVLENSLQELSLHSQEVWDDRAPKVLTLMRKLDHIPLATPTRKGYLSVVRSRSDNWY
nr:MAG: RNA-dependent RNA polymerase [Riboviria sp.]